jgi:hypothetical protein
LSENIKNSSLIKPHDGSKKINFYKVIYIVIVIFAIIGLILPWFIFSKLEFDKNVTTLTGMAGILRFLVGNKGQMVIDIALHNFAIAIFSFILSFLSHGVLGCLYLFFNSFLIGTVLYGIHTFQTILFTFLELSGLCVAVFGGMILAKKRNLDNLSMKNIFKFTIILNFIMAIIYFLAAFIESNLILSKWS